MHLDGDAAAVIGDLDTAVLEDPASTLRRVSGHRLVDGVVDDLPYQMVQTALAGGADIHAGAFADGLQTLENGDGDGAVSLLGALFFAAATSARVSLVLAGDRIWRCRYRRQVIR